VKFNRFLLAVDHRKIDKLQTLPVRTPSSEGTFSQVMTSSPVMTSLLVMTFRNLLELTTIFWNFLKQSETFENFLKCQQFLEFSDTFIFHLFYVKFILERTVT
jgi:hypothetical protein